MDISNPSVMVAEAEPMTKRRRRWWPWVCVGVLCVVIAACFIVPTPYYLFEPGSVRPTASRIEIRRHKSFSDKGELLFTTVGIEHATVSDLVRGWLDDAIEVESESDVYPEGEAKDQIINQKLMDDSKLAAISAAFRTVGYPVTPTGNGAFVEEVIDDFPEAKANLRQGDVIVKLNGRPINVTGDLAPILGEMAVGTEVDLDVRDGRTEKLRGVTMKLGRNEDDPHRGYLGVVVSTADQSLDLPFDVEIDSGKVTGPSAGLAWTLGLIDRLTPGSLTGGRRIAVTGTIDADGRVGEIGGLAQKMATVKRAGVKVFLYPAGTPRKHVAEAAEIAADEVTLHPVASVEDAIRYLLPEGLPKAPSLAG
ncbi:MAG: PDZ domain-containing protein [Microthrixaceae bacterium]|nr:PDZ domain-containing protein [Microthrixaceae bacterium]